MPRSRWTMSPRGANLARPARLEAVRAVVEPDAVVIGESRNQSPSSCPPETQRGQVLYYMPMRTGPPGQKEKTWPQGHYRDKQPVLSRGFPSCSFHKNTSLSRCELNLADRTRGEPAPRTVQSPPANARLELDFQRWVSVEWGCRTGGAHNTPCQRYPGQAGVTLPTKYRPVPHCFTLAYLSLLSVPTGGEVELVRR